MRQRRGKRTQMLMLRRLDLGRAQRLREGGLRAATGGAVIELDGHVVHATCAKLL